MNAVWRKQGITHCSATIYLNALTTMLIHYFGACFTTSLLMKWFWCLIRASGGGWGVCVWNIYAHIFHSKIFPTQLDLA